MLESLTLTSVFGGGTATAFPTANASLGTIEKNVTAKRGSSPIKPTTAQSGIAATISTTASTAIVTGIEESYYNKVLENSLAYVEAMSDEELEAALIEIGELEAEIKTDETIKSI